MTKRPQQTKPLEIRPDPAKAANACRQLILAQLNGQGIEAATAAALAAYGLPANFIDAEGGIWQ